MAHIGNFVLTFSEKAKGWVSFKSFRDMQFGISMANDYYTFGTGEAYKHYSEDQDRNTFYGIPEDSSIDILLNDKPELIKVFNTLNYEGSQSKIDKFIDPSIATLTLPYQPTTTYSDQEYYNLISKDGWSVGRIITDQEEGSINEFLEKEGKWFNNINRSIDISLDIADSSDFTFQGIGEVVDILINGQTPIYGCTDVDAFNYNSLANANDGSCEYLGCTNPLSSNYDPNATIDDGSCVEPPRPGCTDPQAANYDPTAILDDGSCYYEASDCVRFTQTGENCGPYPLNPNTSAGAPFNYSPNTTYGLAAVVAYGGSYWTLAVGVNNSTSGSWIPSEWDECCKILIEKGCTDPLALNYDPDANSDDGSCVYFGPSDPSPRLSEPVINRGIVAGKVNLSPVEIYKKKVLEKPIQRVIKKKY